MIVTSCGTTPPQPPFSWLGGVIAPPHPPFIVRRLLVRLFCFLFRLDLLLLRVEKGFKEEKNLVSLIII